MSVMKKQLMKVRQIADQTFLRTDKTEVLSKELESAEKRLEALKQPCHVLYKKMLACHQGAAQEPTEKRKKRMPEIQLSNSMHEFLGTDLEGNTLLWQVLEGCSALQSSLAEALLEEQVQAEKEVLSTLHEFLEVDIPNVLKLRKQLFKLSQDMDTARTRYESSVRHFQQATGPAQSSAHNKAEGCREEMEELIMKVDQARDTYAAELYSLVSREPFICQSFVQWYEMQTAYHNKCLELLNGRTPALQTLIDKSNHRPLYGYSLEDHLQCTGREIALVLEACICCLVETAINEEGLFRIAGSASKVKKLKNALDAGVTNMFEYALDPHTVAGALKSYLRALPEPLMTYDAYDEWMQADRISDSDARLQRLWQVLNSLPKPNYNNLRYLVKFLHCLCKNSDHNKMSSQNLSIVMSPNLLWSPASQQSNHIGLNMSAANAHSCIVDTLINYCDWFFPDDVVFRLTMPAFPSPKGLLTPPIPDDSGGSSPTSFKGIINTAFEGANGESDESLGGQSPRVIHRPGKKPAPPVPLVLDAAAEAHSLPRTSPPSQVGHPEHPISRSATLDRPGKPKRAPTRKSHDNLASLLPLEGLHQNVNSGQQAASHPENSTTREARADPSSSSPTAQSQSAADQKEFSQGAGGASHLSTVKERSQDRANWFLGESQPLRKEQVSQSLGSGLDYQAENGKEKAQPLEESQVLFKDRQQSQVDSIQDSVAQPILANSKITENQVSDNQKLPPSAETKRKEATTGANQSPERQEVNCGSTDVPFNHETTRKDSVTQNQTEIQSLLPASEPIYENVSSQTKKDATFADPCSQERESIALQEGGPIGQGKTVVQADGSTLSRTGNEGTLPHKDQKPHVPCKPAALSMDRSAQDTNTQVRPKENNLPQEDDEGGRDSTSGGDKWQFLTSTQGVDRIPERPPKVAPAEGPPEGPEDKRPPAPAPIVKVKPPRPQPPLPPAKPRLSTDAEDTRL